MNWPSPPEPNSPIKSLLRKIILAGRADRLMPGIGYRLNRTPGGRSLSIENVGGGGKPGWHWANPREYDETHDYKKDEVVVVSEDGGPLDAAPEFRMLSGIWVCIKDATFTTPPDGIIRVPYWPPPADEDVLFWELIAIRPRLVDVPVTVDGAVNCTDYQAWVHMSEPFLK